MFRSILVFIFFITQLTVSGQSIHFKVGKNYTDFKFTRLDGRESYGIQQGQGASYELGTYYELFDTDRFIWELGLTLNEYNAIVGTQANFISWETNYLGIQNSLSYSFIKKEKFDVGVKLGVQMSKITYGKQNLDGIVYDLKKTDDFKPILVQYIAGIEAKYEAVEGIRIGFGYSLLNSFNESKSRNNKFFINTSQISLGIYFE